MHLSWIRKGLEKPGKTQSGLARALGIAHPQITRLLAGARRIKVDEIPVIAAYLEQSPPMPQVPVVGYVGAGAEVFAIDDHAMGGGVEHIEAPPGFERAIALIVRGDSMFPVFRDGWVIICDNIERDLDDLLNNYCYVKLTDGRVLLKILQKGSNPGVVTLTSHNAPPITDVMIERAYKVSWVKPG